jgi:glucose-1-phosphate thymidylyltransferase
VAHSVFLGYANKSHEGFLGHSVVGQWVNLGAGTITSNLKNTYGEIRLELPTGRIETGRTNLGTIFGDHAKTAIGTLLGTGTVVGTGANVVAAPVPRFVPPFAWAQHDRQTLSGFLSVAGRVLPRRGVDLTPEIAGSLTAIHERLTR